jgi:hypothetical protein
MEGASSRGVVREEAVIVPTGLLTGAGRLGWRGGRSDGAGSPVSGGARDTLEKGDWKRGICCSTTLEGFGR